MKIDVLASIDDDGDDQFLYRRLVMRAGIANTFLTFSSGFEALDYFEQHGPRLVDVILLDINMPQMNGFGFVERATARFGDRLSPIFVMLTSSLNRHDKERAAATKSIRAFYNKPLTVDVLNEIAQKYLL